MWVCPAVVSMTAAEVAAALYAFSDLMDDDPEATRTVVRDELSYVVARYGMAAIEAAAAGLAAAKDGSFRADVLEAIRRRFDQPISRDRLDWCHKQVALAFGAKAPD